jgi:hypothetical protein
MTKGATPVCGEVAAPFCFLEDPMKTKERPTPIWDSKRNTCARWGFGMTFLDELIDAGTVEARQLTPGSRTSKIIVNQASVGAHLESLPRVKIAPPIPAEKRGRAKAPAS